MARTIRGDMPRAGGDEQVLVGVISDTHGLLRDSALDALEGVDRIIHAGDVDEPGILERLEEVAPLSVVRGNVDRGEWADRLPRTAAVEVEDRILYVLHDPDHLDLNPGAAGFAAVIHGHTHEPRNEWMDGVLYLNPGSAGSRRGNRPVTLAHLRVPRDDSVEDLSVEFIDLD